MYWFQVGLFLATIFTITTIVLLLFKEGRNFIKKYYPINILFEDIFDDFYILDVNEDTYIIIMLVLEASLKILLYLFILDLVLFLGSYLIFIPILIAIFIKFKLQKERNKKEEEDSFF